MIDDVRGQIIGGDCADCGLFYEGRQQGGRFGGNTDEAARAEAQKRIGEIRADCGEAFRLIYPKDAWELRIFN